MKDFLLDTWWRVQFYFHWLLALPGNIWRTLTWLPFIWQNHDYDYVSLLFLMKHKLSRIRKHISTHQMRADCDEIAAEIKMHEDFIDKLLGTTDWDPVEKERAAHVAKWGKRVWVEKQTNDPVLGVIWEADYYAPKARELGQEAEEKAESLAISALEEMRAKQALKDFFKSVGDHVGNWWC